MASGTERPVAVVFADLRGFAALSEKRMAYDIVFVLNEYFYRMGRVIEQCGGYVDKLVGDGIIAVFGMEVGPQLAARQALAAAAGMARELRIVNDNLRVGLLDEPLRIGFGVHAGDAIVGELGRGASKQVTTVGDVVTVASRLQESSADLDASLVISSDAARLAGLDVGAFPHYEVVLRGRAQMMEVYAVVDIDALEPALSLPGVSTAAQ